MNELSTLKAIATKLNISFSPNIGANSLTDKIKAHCEEQGLDAEAVLQMTPEMMGVSIQSENTEPVEEGSLDITAKIKSLNLDGLKDTEKVAYNFQDHVIITCLDPDKTHLKGETFTAGNAKYHITKHYLFDKEYYVPRVILASIKDKTFTRYITTKNEKGQNVTTTKQLPAYSIQYLDPITPEELEAIKQRQLLDKGD